MQRRKINIPDIVFFIFHSLSENFFILSIFLWTLSATLFQPSPLTGRGTRINAAFAYVYLHLLP
jgi:hypothetical protein